MYNRKDILNDVFLLFYCYFNMFRYTINSSSMIEQIIIK